VKVLLLEAGGKDDCWWIHVPVGIFYVIGNPRTDWRYMSEPEPGLAGRQMPMPRGRTLGGSSSINGMAYIRGQSADYDQWRQLGNAGWSWDDCLPYFRKSEDFIHGTSESHGSGGFLRVEDARVRWEILDAFEAASVECGIPRSRDFNRGDNEGVGYFQVTQRRARRWSTATAFLRPVMNRPNLRVLTNAQAKGLRFNGKRATGVEFWHGDTLSHAEASGEVILSTGAFGSPQMLQLSGIGPASLLQQHGIQVRQDMPGVGENLQDHLNVRVVKKVHGVETMNNKFHNPIKKMAMGLEYLLFKTGPMTTGAPPLTGFCKSDPSRATPNVQFQATPLSYDKLGEPPHKFPALTVGICNLRPTSRGWVRIKSTDPKTYAGVFNNYLHTADDQRVAIDSIKLLQRIFAAPAMARYRPEDFRPPSGVTADADILEHCRHNSGTVFHPVGTCKMGPDSMAVVDQRLRVHGMQGLRVVDASIMPTLPSGNTNAPTIMVAEKAAEMIKEDRRAGAGTKRAA
jgi:choline dehydrogenase